jgi:protein tyrosine/serine phosphatase
MAALLRKSFGEVSPSSRRGELLDLIASTHPFAGIVPEEDYRSVLREEFSFR